MGNFSSKINSAPSSGPIVAVVVGFCVVILELLNLSYLNQYTWSCPCCVREVEKQDLVSRNLRNAENLGVATALFAAIATVAGIVGAAQRPTKLQAAWWWSLFIVSLIWAPVVTYVASETLSTQAMFDVGPGGRMHLCDSFQDLRYQQREQNMFAALGISAAVQLTIGIFLFLLLLFSLVPTFGAVNGGAAKDASEQERQYFYRGNFT